MWMWMPWTDGRPPLAGLVEVDAPRTDDRPRLAGLLEVEAADRWQAIKQPAGLMMKAP